MIKLFEKFNEYSKIDDWLFDMGISDYTINDDLTVDVAMDVVIEDMELTELPVQFGRVGRYFDCAANNLTTLKGCPTYVGWDFICHSNKLTSLEYCPQEIGNSLICYDNQITSLEYVPKSFTGTLSCYENELTSLKGCPEELVYLHCGRNKLTSLQYVPKVIERQITYDNNPLPQPIYDNERYIRGIIKNQDDYGIWNSDGSFNEKRFDMMIEYIKKGDM